MRVRLLALLSALALLAGACATVPGGAVATVNGSRVDYDRFERIVAAQAAGLGLDARDARTAQSALDAGLIDRGALDNALLEELQRPPGEARIDSGPPLQVDQELLDELLAAQVEASDADALLADLGLSERRFREVFERLVRFEIRGLQINQGQPGFPIDRTQQLAGLQQSVIQQLVQAEITRQAVADLGLEVDDATVAQIEEQLRASFPDDETLAAALEDAGYTDDDFVELFVLTQARQQALQSVEDPEGVQGFFQSLEVQVAPRFGTWDAQQGQVVPPSDPV